MHSKVGPTSREFPSRFPASFVIKNGVITYRYPNSPNWHFLVFDKDYKFPHLKSQDYLHMWFMNVK